MIVHSDTEEDEDQHAVKPESEALSGLNPGPMTRTRKARDAQLRLGVGRPTTSRGRGPRIVTRSVSVAKGARSRSGRGAKPASTPTVEGSSHFRLPLILLEPIICSLYRSVLIRFVLSETLELQSTGTPEGARLPPSNPVTPQPRTTGNGRIRRASTVDTNTDQAGVRAIVEEQVCITLSASIIPQCSVGTAPTAHGRITTKATPATGINSYSRSSCAKRQGYDSYE
jgi:hypothetical protein